VVLFYPPTAARRGTERNGAYEVDGRLDVLDEGGAALVVGGRVAVQAADVVGLPSSAGHRGRVARSQPPGTRRRGAAADQADHLLGLLPDFLPPSSTPPPIGGPVMLHL